MSLRDLLNDTLDKTKVGISNVVRTIKPNIPTIGANPVQPIVNSFVRKPVNSGVQNFWASKLSNPVVSLSNNLSDFYSGKRNLPEEYRQLSQELDRTKFNPVIKGIGQVGLGLTKSGPIQLQGLRNTFAGGQDIGKGIVNKDLGQVGSGAFNSLMGGLQSTYANYMSTSPVGFGTANVAEPYFFGALEATQNKKNSQMGALRGFAQNTMPSEALGIKDKGLAAAVDIGTNLFLNHTYDQMAKANDLTKALKFLDIGNKEEAAKILGKYKDFGKLDLIKNLKSKEALQRKLTELATREKKAINRGDIKAQLHLIFERARYIYGDKSREYQNLVSEYDSMTPAQKEEVIKALKPGRTQLPTGEPVGPRPRPSITRAQFQPKTAIEQPQFVENSVQPKTPAEMNVENLKNQPLQLPSGRVQLPTGEPVTPYATASKVGEMQRLNPQLSEQGQVMKQDPETAYRLWKLREDRINPQISNLGVNGTRIPDSTSVDPLHQDRILSPSADLATTGTKNPLGSKAGQVSQGVPQGNVSSEANIAQTDPVQKIISALTGAKSLRGKQEKLYSQERSKRVGQIIAIGQNVGGEKGFYAQLGKLKGELPKVSFESIRSQVGQADIDTLFNRIESSKILTPFDKITAKGGLAKLLGAEGGTVPTKGEISLLNEVFGSEFTKAVLAKRPLMERVMAEAGDALNVPRAIQATLDLSAPLRQGVFLIGRPKQWLPAFGQMFKYAFNEKAYNGLIEQIQSRPTYQAMREAKLSLTSNGQILTNREETFMSKLAERIPVFGGLTKVSERAYTGFLNKLRADVFDDLYRVAKEQGILEQRPEVAKDIANFVNTATGRGELGKLGTSSQVLTNIFFSPRLMASRINLLNPMYYAKLDPFVRKEALKSLLTFAGTGMTVLGLAHAAGAQVGTDPRSADFGKIKVGNTRLDIWGGFQQYIRLAAQLISGQKVDSETGKIATLGEGYGTMTRKDILFNFFEGKEAPATRFIMGLLQGKDGAGQPIDVPSETVSMFIPLIVQDMYEISKEQGPVGLLLGAPGIFGVNTQTYGSKIPNLTTTESGKPKIEYKNVPGLPEDIVNTIRGTPVSNIPQSQWQGLNDARKAQNRLDVAKENLKGSGISGNIQQVENSGKIIYLDGDTVKTVKTSIKLPTLTNNAELNKKLVSTYKSELSDYADYVVFLYKSGKMSQEQAGKILEDLKAKNKALNAVTSVKSKGKYKIPNFAKIAQQTLKPVEVRQETPRLRTQDVLDEFSKLKANAPKIEVPNLKKGKK